MSQNYEKNKPTINHCFTCQKELTTWRLQMALDNQLSTNCTDCLNQQIDFNKKEALREYGHSLVEAYEAYMFNLVGTYATEGDLEYKNTLTLNWFDKLLVYDQSTLDVYKNFVKTNPSSTSNMSKTDLRLKQAIKQRVCQLYELDLNHYL